MAHAETERRITQDIAEMMRGWDTIMAAARAQFPAANDAELFSIASGAMNQAIGLKAVKA